MFRAQGRGKQFGGIAQLGERLTGSQEVSGSIPLISTKKTHFQKEMGFFTFFTFFVRRLRLQCPESKIP